MVSSEEQPLPLGGSLRSHRRDRAAMFAAAVGVCAVVLCVLAVVSLSSHVAEGSGGDSTVELTELPDGKSYMMNMLRDRVRALRGKGEGRDDTVVNKNQDKEISALYGKLDSEAPPDSLSAGYEAALGEHRFQLPSLNVPVSQTENQAALLAQQAGDPTAASLAETDTNTDTNVDEDQIRAAGLSADPVTRRAAQLESSKAFALFQAGGGATGSSPMLLETSAQSLSQQQVDA